MGGRVVSVNISTEKGTRKRAVPEIRVDRRGVAGDAHAGDWHRQVSLLSREVIDGFGRRMGRTVENGEFAENITLEGLDIGGMCLLDRLFVGAVELEVTQVGKACHGDKCAIFREAGECIMPKEGIFCRVIRGGVARPGDAVSHSPRTLKVMVVTASDRASRGEYEDRTGPAVQASLEAFFAGKRWRCAFQSHVVPDEAPALRGRLDAFAAEGGDVAVIAGGTGIGPRDVTPEVVSGFCERIIPGIMESIRIKYGADKPNALLSRSVAGVKGSMLVYAIPGSPHGAREYMDEILKTMEHALMMLHGVDAH